MGSNIKNKLADIQMNFQMFEPDVEKAEAQEIKLPASIGS